MPRPPFKRSGILADTNIWIAALEKPDLAIAEAFKRAREAGRMTLIQPVRFEILRGIRGRGRFDYVRGYLRGFPLVPLVEADWDVAATLANQVAATRGKHRVQMTDLLLAAVAVRTGLAVWSRDPDVADRIAPHAAGLGVFEP